MGDLHGGHYCAFICPEKNGKWYYFAIFDCRFKFDDDKVYYASTNDVYEDNFGGEQLYTQFEHKYKRLTNAYMLVYIREHEIDEILKPVTEEEIPSHLSTFL